MVQAAIAGAAYAALSEENRKRFHARCFACGASPKQWCEDRLGTICSYRGEAGPNDYMCREGDFFGGLQGATRHRHMTSHTIDSPRELM